MPTVTILATDHIAPSPPKDSCCFHAPRDTIPLSFLDVNWLPIPYTLPLFLYPDTNGHSFSSILQSLKSSLSKTLTKFYPLAGKLAYAPDTNDIVIDCRECSVEFTEAECSADIDIKKLASDDIHDTEMFMKLVPEIDRAALPLPAMAVQVTGFSEGGVAVGLAINHAVADGNGKRMFYEAWAAACRGDDELFDDMAVVHDREVIRYAGGEEIARATVKKIFPNLPKIGGRSTPIEERLRLQRRTFILSASAIQSLKERITDQLNDSKYRLSTFTTIAAYMWVCVAQLTNSTAANNNITNLLFLVDCRNRLDPPIPTYTGNCLHSGRVEAAWSELLGPCGLSAAQAMIARAVREGTKGDLLTGSAKGFENFMRIPESGRVMFSRSNRFFCSQTDFGWGKPGRFEMAGMNGVREIMVDGMDEGKVKLSIALEPMDMDEFAKVFADGLKF